MLCSTFKWIKCKNHLLNQFLSAKLHTFELRPSNARPSSCNSLQISIIVWDHVIPSSIHFIVWAQPYRAHDANFFEFFFWMKYISSLNFNELLDPNVLLFIFYSSSSSSLYILFVKFNSLVHWIWVNENGYCGRRKKK